jgi:cytochrome c oxidase subunit II
MGFLLAVIIWIITAVSVWVLGQAKGNMPATISHMAREIDAQFFLTLTITGIVFVVAQGILGLFILKYRDRPNASVRYIHGNNLVEAGGAIVIGIVFMSLAITAQRVWAHLHLTPSPANAVVVEITGEQFAWNIRYPGADGQFGRTAPERYDAQTNPMGIDPADPAGKDDVVVLNTLAVPVNRPIELRVGSKDVIHSFFLPVLRIKQDTVPGMRIPLRFTAEQAGNFEIACAELCGLGHYRMRGFLQVMQEPEFERWLQEQKGQ